MRLRLAITMAGVAILSACSPPPEQAGTGQNQVNLRGLTQTSASSKERGEYQLHGHLVPTPSHADARYYVLFQKPVLLRNTVVAIFRQERDHRVSYARVEADCEKRLFHVLGVGNRRSFAETNISYDGPLRPIENLPLRQDLASYICKANGTPLAPPRQA